MTRIRFPFVAPRRCREVDHVRVHRRILRPRGTVSSEKVIRREEGDNNLLLAIGRWVISS